MVDGKEKAMTRTSIKPRVRSDGISFVDMEHFEDGSPIVKFICLRQDPHCGYETTEVKFYDDEEPMGDGKPASAEGTLGFYGVNGNGYNYWCPKCQYRMKPIGKTDTSKLDKLFGFNQ